MLAGPMELQTSVTGHKRAWSGTEKLLRELVRRGLPEELLLPAAALIRALDELAAEREAA